MNQPTPHQGAQTRGIRDGFVAWPSQLAESYRRHGWWPDQTLGSLPEFWAQARPGQAALLEDNRTVTTDELADRVRATAGRLLALGLRGGPEGDRLLVQLPNTTELVILVLACARAGIVPVLALPAHRQSDLSPLVHLAEARGIVVPQSFRNFDHEVMAHALADAHPTLEHVLVLPTESRALMPGHHDLGRLTDAGGSDTSQLATTPSSPPRPDDVALLLLSGGTTGTPKLIPRTHNDYIYNFRASSQACEWDDGTVFLASVPITHNFALGCPGVLGALDVGGRAVLLASPEPRAALAAINRHAVTDVAVVPAVLQRWLELARSTGAAFPTLRAVQVGGARLPEEVARQVEPVLGATLQQALGMAEGLINYTRLADPIDIACLTQGRPVSPGDEIRIVDPDGNDVSEGEPGELLARGPYTIRGYWRAPEHNARAFTADGWYRTGDIVRRHPSNNLIVEGRSKDVINRGGEKISAEEVENLLYRLPSIARVAAVAASDPTLGERVAAVVVPADAQAPPTLEELRAALISVGVAHFKLPEILVLTHQLPLTKVGKLDKTAIRAMVVPDADTPLP